jgi:hypothetical protein
MTNTWLFVVGVMKKLFSVCRKRSEFRLGYALTLDEFSDACTNWQLKPNKFAVARRERVTCVLIFYAQTTKLVNVFRAEPFQSNLRLS